MYEDNRSIGSGKKSSDEDEEEDEKLALDDKEGIEPRSSSSSIETMEVLFLDPKREIILFFCFGITGSSISVFESNVLRRYDPPAGFDVIEAPGPGPGRAWSSVVVLFDAGFIVSFEADVIDDAVLSRLLITGRLLNILLQRDGVDMFKKAYEDKYEDERVKG